MDSWDLSSEINPRCTTHVSHLGKYRTDVIIDDFFKDPTKIRDLALSTSYSRRCNNYPGVRSRAQLDFFEPVLDLLEEHLSYPRNRYVSQQGEFCHCTGIRTEDYKLHTPHIDFLGGVLAGIGYFSRPSSVPAEPPSIGTAPPACIASASQRSRMSCMQRSSTEISATTPRAAV